MSVINIYSRFCNLKDSRAFLLLILLLVIDVGFIITHCLNYFSLVAYHPKLSITKDHSYSEIFQYLKFFWIATLNVSIAFKTRKPIYCIWSLFFLFLLADDALTLHESVGILISEYLPKIEIGLRAQDIGEAIFTSLSGCILLGLIAVGYYFSEDSFKRYSISLILLIAILVFFGVGVDILHILFRESTLNFTFGLLEDGGEMISSSLIMWFCAYQHLNCHNK